MNWSFPNNVIIQGISESQAAFYAVQMKAYGTEIIAGVSPGKGGTQIEDIPVFDLVEQILTITDKIDTSLIFVPPYQVLDATIEAIASGIRRIIIFTSNIPAQEAIKIIKYAEANNTLLLGPGSQGIIIPEQLWMGSLQPQFYQSGNVGLITTSEHLSYEVAAELNSAGSGQSMVVSLGSERIIGSDLTQWLSILDEDPNTETIVFVGHRIDLSEEIVTYCQGSDRHKPIIVYIAGLEAPQETVFRDAITIISNHLSASIPAENQGKHNIAKLETAGIKVAKRPGEIPTILSEIFHSRVKTT